jgi:DNA repair protein RecN (Recombination protein N)
MLSRLQIDNYALIRRLDTEFGSGLNIITGETGAGKSILIGAIGLLLGDRADTSVLLEKEKLCKVEGWFEPIQNELRTYLESLEIWLEPGEALRLKREISPAGKSRALINETVVNLAVLKEVGNTLAEIHGQQDTRLLNEPQAQLQLFDLFASTQEERTQYEIAFQEWTILLDQLHSLKHDQAEWLRSQEYIRFQFEELYEAQLKPAEDEKLDQELKKLESSEQIRETLSTAFTDLYDRDLSVYNQLAGIQKQLAKFESLDTKIGEENIRIHQALELIREVALSLQDLESESEANPEKLSQMQERQNLYQKLKLKYQVRTASELIQLRDELETKVLAGDSATEAIKQTEQKLAKQQELLIQKGILLDKKRSKQVKPFQQKISTLLAAVGMEGAQCIPDLSWNIRKEGQFLVEGNTIEPLRSGLNAFRLLVQTNPGTPAGPLNSIASGGELSRIMLAIKTSIATQTGTPVLIFDEIDTGISGETALKVGRVMKELAQDTQVFSITHLPQIAAKGDQHYLLFKGSNKGYTASDIRKLPLDERIQAIAEMIGGAQPGKAALDHAKELIGKGE